MSQNGKISFEEFVCGLAILLHGSFSNKCQLLFQVFNIHGDEGELMHVTSAGRVGGLTINCLSGRLSLSLQVIFPCTMISVQTLSAKMAHTLFWQ